MDGRGHEGDLGAVRGEHRIPVVVVALGEAPDTRAVEVSDVDVTRTATAAVADHVHPGQLGAVWREGRHSVHGLQPGDPANVRAVSIHQVDGHLAAPVAVAVAVE